MGERKVYTTKNRTEILSFLKNNSSKAISASDIIKYMNSINIKVNQTTIYRYLDKLCNEHIINKYPDSSGEKSVYQYSENNTDSSDNLHLKCKECGNVFNMDCSFINEFSDHLLNDHDFIMQCKGNILYGICKNCSKKNSTDK